MRPMRTMRNSRPARVAAGALMLAVPTAATAAAVTVGQADAQSALQIDVSSSHVAYGGVVRVNGTAPASAAGQTVLLQFARSGATSWQSLSSARVGGDGRFMFAAPLHRTGLIRALTAGDATPTRATAMPTVSSTTVTLSSDARTVAVAPKFRLSRHSFDVLGGQSFTVRGELLPGIAGRRVRLENRAAGRWHVIGSARTGARGGFRIQSSTGSASPSAAGHGLRVAFRGDRLNTRAVTHAGRVVVFRESLASWYNDGGNTACGFHAALGVANKDLPCGTKVSFRYGANTVTAVVDDRGPFVGGREWDLNQNTAAALGFGGVGTVWTTA
jgi:rare lipoprotein A